MPSSLEVIPPDLVHKDFVILPSVEGGVATPIGRTSRSAPSCLGQSFRRGRQALRYPFINCTYWWPPATPSPAVRLYDRARTAWPISFSVRFARQNTFIPVTGMPTRSSNACPVCGPKLELYEPSRRACAGTRSHC